MSDEGEKLLKRAAVLKERFNREFWMPEKQFYAMALDGHHRQVDTLTSNPGHCLWTGLIAEEHAAETAKTLLSGPMASSWGIRTMANNEKAYNPLSYHNGSVWPFENTLIGAGLQTYGYTDESAEVFDVLLDASSHFEYGRWPEVYCGVQRDLLFVLALQPDASRPQAWSAGAIFLWVQTWLGITPHPFSKRVDISPALPPDIDRITAENLSIAGSHLSLAISRHRGWIYRDSNLQESRWFGGHDSAHARADSSRAGTRLSRRQPKQLPVTTENAMLRSEGQN